MLLPTHLLGLKVNLVVELLNHAELLLVGRGAGQAALEQRRVEPAADDGEAVVLDQPGEAVDLAVARGQGAVGGLLQFFEAGLQRRDFAARGFEGRRQVVDDAGTYDDVGGGNRGVSAVRSSRDARVGGGLVVDLVRRRLLLLLLAVPVVPPRGARLERLRNGDVLLGARPLEGLGIGVCRTAGRRTPLHGQLPGTLFVGVLVAARAGRALGSRAEHDGVAAERAARADGGALGDEVAVEALREPPAQRLELGLVLVDELSVLLRDKGGVFCLAGGVAHLPCPALLPALKVLGLADELEVQLERRAWRIGCWESETAPMRRIKVRS